MLIQHGGIAPRIPESSFVAPNAVVCGDVEIGQNCQIMYGASVVAEGGRIVLGDNCVVLENAVLRSTPRFDLTVGRFVIIGPQAHVVGCTIGDEVFIATGAAVFHGARLENGSEVRIHAVVHIKTLLPEGATVPIGWVAVGNPARILPPEEHEAIWEIQKGLDFPGTVYGVDRTKAPNTMRAIVLSLGDMLKDHRNDTVA